MDKQKLAKYVGLGIIALVAALMLIALIRENATGRNKYFGDPDAGPLPVLPFDPLDPNNGGLRAKPPLSVAPSASASPSASGAAGASSKN